METGAYVNFSNVAIYQNPSYQSYHDFYTIQYTIKKKKSRMLLANVLITISCVLASAKCYIYYRMRNERIGFFGVRGRHTNRGARSDSEFIDLAYELREIDNVSQRKIKKEELVK